MVLTPPAVYEDQIIDHNEIYAECESRFGRPTDFAIRSTYNPRTDNYFGFCGAYAPPLITYRRDLWDPLGGVPATWNGVLTGGRRINLLHKNPIGISLAAEHNGEHTLRAILYSFGGSIQDEAGNPALASKPTLEAIRYVKSLYEQAMLEDVLTWDASSNNRFMLTGDGSLTLDTISIVRASENTHLPIADQLGLAGVPEGPAGRLAPTFGLHTYFIWSFAQNIDLAKRFLVDYVAQSRQGFIASEFQNMPTFPQAVPDLRQLAAEDPASAIAPGKYETALAIDHAHGAVQRYLVHLDLAATLAHVVLELAHRGAKRVPDRDVDVLVRVVSGPGMRYRQLLAGRVDLDPDPEQVALVAMAMLLFHDHAATGDPVGEALELGYLLADSGLNGRRGIHLTEADLEGSLHLVLALARLCVLLAGGTADRRSYLLPVVAGALTSRSDRRTRRGA
jgi:hypothetical protein